jgi:outer membrane protein TolC
MDTARFGKRILLFSSAFFMLISVSPLTGLSFETVMEAADNNFDLQNALLEVERLEAEVRAATLPDDIRFAFNPSLKVLTEIDGEFAGETSVSGYTSVAVPFSLSGDEKDRLQAVRNSLAIARSDATEVRAASYIKIASLYQDLWLLQQEAEVLEAEVAASELYMELMQERFNTGAISLASFNQADETRIERQEAQIRNTLEQRLAWFELSLNTGLEGDLPRLEALEIRIGDIPKPPELEDWIIRNHPVPGRSRMIIDLLRQTTARQLEPDIDVSIKPFWNYQEHSVALTYTIFDPEFIAGYTFPIRTWDEIPSGSGSSVETWSTGVSVNISLGSNRYDRLSATAAEISIREEESRLEYLVQSTFLKVRSAYQQLLRSNELVMQARRNLERSISNRRIVEAKRELDQAPRHEVLEAVANEARGAWRLRAAEIGSEKAFLNLLKEAALFDREKVFGN